ncbi:hypothetical protein Tco_0358310 [Tanacetum coccineum]
MVGASVVIVCVAIGRRLVVSGITDTRTFYTDGDWIWEVSCWMGISNKELTSISTESLTLLTKEESEESLRN